MSFGLWRVESIARKANRAEHRTETFNPLGPNAETIYSRVPGVDGPAVRIGQLLSSSGTLCNRSDKTLTVRSSLYWVAVDDKGREIPGSEASQFASVEEQRKPGCTTRSYPSPVPQIFVYKVKLTGKPLKAQIVLLETPERPDGGVGTRVKANSPTFLVVP